MQKLLLCSKIRKLTRLVKPIPWQGGEQHKILTRSEVRTDATQQLSACAVPPTGKPRDRLGLSLHLLPVHLPEQPSTPDRVQAEITALSSWFIHAYCSCHAVTDVLC